MTDKNNLTFTLDSFGEANQGQTNQNESLFSGLSKNWADYSVLLAEQLLLIRNTLPFYLFLQTVVPLAFVFALGHYGGSQPPDLQLLRIISGTVTFNLAYLGLMSIASKLSFMRQEGTLVYYYSLPISKVAFVAAILTARTIILFPSIVVPLVGGWLFYGLNLHLSFWLLPILLLGTFTLSLAGTALGVLIKSHELVLLLTNALVFVMALASPTFLPVSALPLPLQLLGWILPTTYISDALTQSLAGSYSQSFYLDLLALIIMSGLALVVTINFLKWRVD